VEADARVSTADYVEARGILVASTEYFTRAIASAERRRSLTGELLTQVCRVIYSGQEDLQLTIFRQQRRT